MNKSLIDNDFLDDDEDDGFDLKKGREFADDLPKEKEVKEPDGDIEVDIVDDTPEKDRGKWVAEEDDEIPDVDNDEEIRSYSDRVQKRIKTETARSHAYRRAAEQHERQMKELERAARAMFDENTRLREMVKGGEQILVKEHKGRLEGQMMAAKAAYREAHEAGDVEAMATAQEQISRVAAALQQSSMYRPTDFPQQKFEDVYRPPQPAPQVDQSLLEWREKNKWFDSEPLMREYALAVHKQITQAEGVLPDNPNYLKRIDNEMRKRFPEKFKDSSQPRRRSTIVAPADRTGSGSARRVTLTESQVRVARRLGITPEQYAKELVKQEKANR